MIALLSAPLLCVAVTACSGGSPAASTPPLSAQSSRVARTPDGLERPDTKAIFNVHVFDPNDAGLGVNPEAGLYQDAQGDLFGTTKAGGQYTFGNAFEVTGTQYTVLHDFAGGVSDGAYPIGVFVAGSNGVLYGTTSHGGNAACEGQGCGTVFSLTPQASGYTEKVLYSFTGPPDGAVPQAGVVLYNNVLYGTTSKGGASDGGTVFALPLGAAGDKVLHSFSGADGTKPNAALLVHGGNFYGTTSGGGNRGGGTVFEISPAGQFQVLHTFGLKLDGVAPEAPLVAAKGKLFGTTSLGGSAGFGMVFSLQGTTSYSDIYDFQGPQAGDGSDPRAALTLAPSGALFGTTTQGGTGTCASKNGDVFGCGTLFKLEENGLGTYTETVLHQFEGVPDDDGAQPASALVLDGDELFGTANNGGEGGSICPAGCGILYRYN
jgi:uncharacterized repeat protein (TIGR03803 family)